MSGLHTRVLTFGPFELFLRSDPIPNRAIDNLGRWTIEVVTRSRAQAWILIASIRLISRRLART